MGSIGPTELLLIALVVVLIFGAGRIAEIGKGLGEGIRNFKKGIKDDGSSDEPAQLPERASEDDDEDDEDDEDERPRKSRKGKGDKKVVKKSEKRETSDEDED